MSPYFTPLVAMRLADLVCPNPNCRVRYREIVEATAYGARCPSCLQVNIVPGNAQLIDGRCPDCEKPLDDHRWEGSRTVGCP